MVKRKEVFKSIKSEFVKGKARFKKLREYSKIKGELK